MTHSQETSSQSAMRAAMELLEERRGVLAHAGDDCSEHHTVLSALRAGTATPDQVLGYLQARETQRRLNSSGVGVDRWARLVLELQERMTG